MSEHIKRNVGGEEDSGYAILNDLVACVRSLGVSEIADTCIIQSLVKNEPDVYKIVAYAKKNGLNLEHLQECVIEKILDMVKRKDSPNNLGTLSHALGMGAELLNHKFLCLILDNTQNWERGVKHWWIEENYLHLHEILLVFSKRLMIPMNDSTWNSILETERAFLLQKVQEDPELRRRVLYRYTTLSHTLCGHARYVYHIDSLIEKILEIDATAAPDALKR